jgi:hypothetical protein
MTIYPYFLQLWIQDMCLTSAYNWYRTPKASLTATRDYVERVALLRDASLMSFFRFTQLVFSLLLWLLLRPRIRPTDGS